MNFRARLSLFALETRENPSVPGIDPTGGTAPAPVTTTTTTTATTTTDPTSIALAAATAGATVPTTNVLTATNSIYNTPVVGPTGP
ncbi:hypothetical protein FTUN_1418 [Frigoriglobus tundricola]|uniref:Uncharacterized protein n=2 Tax=Frigoriglobus tundricola TaxID=2774151 RepID=A0A6M5YJZ9_9BACT|nr:hypothetical protein FTUN_1418 [Frigoriglobus tundricola]